MKLGQSLNTSGFSNESLDQLQSRLNVLQKQLEQRNLAKLEFPGTGLGTPAGQDFNNRTKAPATLGSGSGAPGGQPAPVIMTDEAMNRLANKTATAVAIAFATLI